MDPQPQLYRDPALYDLIHADGTDADVLLLDTLAQRHGNGGRRALEPACGSGRYLSGLLRRGWTVAGYDLSPEMVAYARKRLAQWGKRVHIMRGDMTRVRPPQKYDLAFNLLSTFRHLLTERQAAAHLRITGDALNPGGIYVLGLDLAVYGEDQADEEVWTARRGEKTVNHVMMTLPPEPDLRRERVMNFVSFPGRRGEKVLKSFYDLRSYDAGEIEGLIERTDFSLAACYGYDGSPATLRGPERALWLVLLKSGEKRGRHR